MKNALVIISLVFSTIAFGQSDSVGQRQMNERDRIYSEGNSRSRENESTARPKSPLAKFNKILTKADREKLKPSREEFAKFSAFLKLSDTGIIKLFEYPHCNANLIDVSDEKCLEAIRIVGNASLYSFKSKSYTDYQNRNLFFFNGKFSVFNGNSGLITDFGDVEIEKLDKDSSQIKALKTLKLGKSESEITEQNKKFLKGIEIDGQIYKNIALFKLNSTYALRSLKYFRQFLFAPSKNIKLEEIVVVFKVVNKNDDGSVTLIWREL
jgi:hypothetical protein